MELTPNWGETDSHLFLNIIIDFLKENSGLPSDVESTHVTFNSFFVNGLNRDLFLLVQRTRMEWETMYTLVLINLAHQLAHILGEPPRSNIAKFFLFSALANQRPYAKLKDSKLLPSWQRARTLEKGLL